VNEALSRAGIAPSLREALEQLDGPIRDMARERAERELRWEAVFAAPGCAAVAALVSKNAGRGLVKRLARGDPDRGRGLLDAAAMILGALPAQGVPLSRLAAERLGDSHALDDGRPVATLVVAALRGAEVEERAREVWARSGVLVNELASPVLTLNLAAHADTPGGRLVEQALGSGEPVHLSLRTLVRQPPRWALEGRNVFVCENPAVVAMAADALGQRCAPLVCTDGMPAAAQRTLLGRRKPLCYITVTSIGRESPSATSSCVPSAPFPGALLPKTTTLVVVAHWKEGRLLRNGTRRLRRKWFGVASL
jgi:uncharacterized protein (TIGR02679 family)